MVEPRRRGSSQRPGSPHRAGQASHRVQADHLGHGRGKGARTPARKTQAARAGFRGIGSRQPVARRVRSARINLGGAL